MISVTIAGRLGEDAKRKKAGTSDVVEFSVGCRVGKDETTWVRCSLWGKRGDTLLPMLRRGTSVAVTGRGKVRAYTGKGADGGQEPRASLEIAVDDVALLGRASDGDSGGRSSGGYDEPRGGGRREPEPMPEGDDLPW